MAQLQREQHELTEKMKAVQKEIDARVPLYVLRGKKKERKYGPFAMGIFSTFEKALDAFNTLEQEGKHEQLAIHAVPKSNVNFERGYGYRPRVLELDGPIDPVGYISD